MAMDKDSVIYISYRDDCVHEDIRIGPYLSDIKLTDLLETISNLPKTAIGVRVIMNRLDIDFKNANKYLNTDSSFRN